MRSYEHTQRSPLWLLLFVPAMVAIVAAGLTEEAGARVAVLAFAVVFALLSACFATLTVCDRETYLDVRFGPLPWFGTKVEYDTVLAAEVARSRLIDGWGIHWVPWRGWTFNLWGFDCVEVTTTKGVIRIGTDDREELARFLAAHIPALS